MNTGDPVTHRLAGGLVRQARYVRVGTGHDVPIHLIWHEKQEGPRPIMLCLHGTNTGIHLAWGAKLAPPDPVKIARGADYARQAVAQGYVAVCIEQSCFGERQERHLSPRSADPCIDAANHALLLGRTLLGERTSDVSSVIDWLAAHGADLPVQVEPTRLAVVGDSSGGTTALFATALDERIRGLIAGSCAGFVRDTIARRYDPSGQNVIPGMLEWMEFDDVVGLCAPRPTLLIAGRTDHIWPAAGGAAVAESARAIFEAFSAAGNIRAVACDGGHRFYPDAAWPAFAELFGEQDRCA